MPASGLVYVIGYPGSGKSTALALALQAPITAVHKTPFAHIAYADGTVQLGANRAAFSGTDALPLNVQPTVLKWLPSAPGRVIVAEGDRLGNDKFFRAVVGLGMCLRIVLIGVTELQARYRSWKRGHDFDGRFFRGRTTKVDNLERRWRNCMTSVDGTQPPEAVAADVRAALYG